MKALVRRAPSVYNVYSLAPSDFGGASGTALLGRGAISSGLTFRYVTDCAFSFQNNTASLTADGGAFTQSSTFTGTGDQANNFGNVIFATVRRTDGST